MTFTNLPRSSSSEFRNRPIENTSVLILPVLSISYTIGLRIPTLEGEMLGRQNDLIIKGINGEFYPCKPDIFEKTYEPVIE